MEALNDDHSLHTFLRDLNIKSIVTLVHQQRMVKSDFGCVIDACRWDVCPSQLPHWVRDRAPIHPCSARRRERNIWNRETHPSKFREAYRPLYKALLVPERDCSEKLLLSKKSDAEAQSCLAVLLAFVMMWPKSWHRNSTILLKKQALNRY